MLSKATLPHYREVYKDYLKGRMELKYTMRGPLMDNFYMKSLAMTTGRGLPGQVQV